MAPRLRSATSDSSCFFTKSLSSSVAESRRRWRSLATWRANGLPGPPWLPLAKRPRTSRPPLWYLSTAGGGPSSPPNMPSKTSRTRLAGMAGVASLSYRSDIDMGAPPKGVSRRRDECGGRGSPGQRQLQRVQLVFRRQTSPQRGAARAYVAICIVTLLDRELLGRLCAWHQCGATLRVAFLDDAERRATIAPALALIKRKEKPRVEQFSTRGSRLLAVVTWS